MNERSFTGERLETGDELFGVDLARHRAAYRFAWEEARGGRVLDLGSGSGYGSAELASQPGFVIGLDRVAPEPQSRVPGTRWVRANVDALPLAPTSFDLVVSFQVIEHLDDPTAYLHGMAQMLRPGGKALITTPNRLTSDGANPYHVHEYLADELADLLRRHFREVEVRGIGMSAPAARYHAARLAQIQRITRLDPFNIRTRLPHSIATWLFARFAILVRRGIQRGEGLPELTWRDFPIGPADDECVDLLAICQDQA